MLNKLWAFVLLLLVTFALPVAAQDDPGVSDARFSRLARGINLTGWFWYAPSPLERVDARFSDADFDLIRDLGFTFVRVPVDLGFVMDATAPDLLNHDQLAYLDRALNRLFERNLAVVIDLHSTSLADSDASNYSGALEDPAFVDTFEQFWRSFAAYLSTRDPEMIFFEPMNEPVFEADPQQWPPIQARLLAAIREAAPEHTLIATGALWSNMETLLALEPLDDTNIIYNFHFYEPFIFTHQGATWTWEGVLNLADLPYPSSPDAVAPVIERLRNEDQKGYVRQYGLERWNADKIDSMIARAAAWGEEHGVRLLCDEFGAYSVHAPLEDRAVWVGDVRRALEKYNIGWAMWDYDDAFGLLLATGTRPLVNPLIAESLGLAD